MIKPAGIPSGSIICVLSASLCGEVFTAQVPEGVGEKKYDETAASMVVNLKYGAGFLFYRLEKLQGNLGIPLAAPTWNYRQTLAKITNGSTDDASAQAP